jgi:hypothetical protein
VLGELELPGLTDELRWTWLTLREEIAVEAARWGDSPTYFLPISWARWKEILGINSINAIKTRLARLEDLGLIEVQPSECGCPCTTGGVLSGWTWGDASHSSVRRGFTWPRGGLKSNVASPGVTTLLSPT